MIFRGIFTTSCRLCVCYIRCFITEHFYINQNEQTDQPRDYSIKFTPSGASSIPIYTTEKTLEQIIKEKVETAEKPKEKPPPLELYQKWLKLEEESDHQHHADFDHNTVTN